MVHIALEGRCFVLAACQYSTEGDYSAASAATVSDPESRSSEKVVIGGGSVIISPSGQVLAGPLRNQEGVLTAEIDLDDIIRAKFDLDVTGHYSRPDGAWRCGYESQYAHHSQYFLSKQIQIEMSAD